MFSESILKLELFAIFVFENRALMTRKVKKHLKYNKYG